MCYPSRLRIYTYTTGTSRPTAATYRHMFTPSPETYTTSTAWASLLTLHLLLQTRSLAGTRTISCRYNHVTALDYRRNPHSQTRYFLTQTGLRHLPTRTPASRLESYRHRRQSRPRSAPPTEAHLHHPHQTYPCLPARTNFKHEYHTRKRRFRVFRVIPSPDYPRVW